MTVTKKNGGFAIAVYSDRNKLKAKKNSDTLMELLLKRRVDYLAEADYTQGSDLYNLIQTVLQIMFKGINYGFRSIDQYNKYENHINSYLRGH